MDLEYFLLRFLDLIIHQEVPKLFCQQELRGLVDKTTAQQPKIQQFETDRRQELGVKNFSVKIPRPRNSSRRSTGFQDRQAVAATSGYQHQYTYKFFGIYIT